MGVPQFGRRQELDAPAPPLQPGTEKVHLGQWAHRRRHARTGLTVLGLWRYAVVAEVGQPG